MSHKLCPWSFFAFYVNKDSAQAGGAHHCVEDSCALWDGNQEQCSIKSVCDAIGVISDAYADGVETPAKKAAATGVSSVLDRLRQKRKLPTTTDVTTTNPVTAPNPSTAPLATSAISSAAPAPTPAPVSVVPVTSLDDLLNPPEIPISQLPIITIKSEDKK